MTWTEEKENKLRFLEAFYYEVWASDMVSSDTTYAIAMKAEEKTGCNVEGNGATYHISIDIEKQFGELNITSFYISPDLSRDDVKELTENVIVNMFDD